jgi:hypothetical protein
MRTLKILIPSFVLGAVLTSIIFVAWIQIPGSTLLTALLPTNTPIPTVTPTPTATATASPIPTATIEGLPTPVPVPTYDHGATYDSKISNADLATYADRYAWKYVYVVGHVFNVIDDRTFQMYLGGWQDYDYPVTVAALVPLQNVYKDTVVGVRAMMYGFYTSKNTMGGDLRQPLLVYGDITVIGSNK